MSARAHAARPCPRRMLGSVPLRRRPKHTGLCSGIAIHPRICINGSCRQTWRSPNPCRRVIQTNLVMASMAACPGFGADLRLDYWMVCAMPSGRINAACWTLVFVNLPIVSACLVIAALAAPSSSSSSIARSHVTTILFRHGFPMRKQTPGRTTHRVRQRTITLPATGVAWVDASQASEGKRRVGVARATSALQHTRTRGPR